MASPNFEQLVKNFADRQQQEAAKNAARWEDRKAWWIERVHDLFDQQIKRWLKPLVESGAVAFKPSMYPAYEADIGSYNIEQLVLEVAGKKLTFLPKGTLVAAASGRIDVNGPEGDASLVLVEGDANLPPQERRAQASWFIRHPSRPASRSSELRPLNESTFQQLFADLFGIQP